MQNLADTIKGTIGVGASAAAVVVAPDDLLRVIPACLGCVVTLVTIWSIMSRNKRERRRSEMQELIDAQTICHVCRQDGTPPIQCPYPDNALPLNCLKRN